MTHSPHPLGQTLPALYLEDAFVQRMCTALDEVLAPVITVLDCFPAYLDPATTPSDILDWLASWLGLPGVAELPLERRRALVRHSATLYARRGTVTAVQELLELATGRPVELDESGGSGWSREAGTPLPGRDRPGLLVRIRAAGPPTGRGPATPVDVDVVARLLRMMVPANVPWWIEVERAPLNA